MQLCQRAGMRLLGLNDHEGLWSKKEEFWGNKQNGDFRENVLKETYYKDRFMGKSSKSLLSFFNKDMEISKQSFIKQKYILLFSTRI